MTYRSEKTPAKIDLLRQRETLSQGWYRVLVCTEYKITLGQGNWCILSCLQSEVAQMSSGTKCNKTVKKLSHRCVWNKHNSHVSTCEKLSYFLLTTVPLLIKWSHKTLIFFYHFYSLLPFSPAALRTLVHHSPAKEITGDLHY